MELTELLLASIPFAATALSAWLVFKAQKGDQLIKGREILEAQRQAEVDRLREDLHQADELYRAERARSVMLARERELYRFWGYNLRRMLVEDGLGETLIPPEPNVKEIAE